MKTTTREKKGERSEKPLHLIHVHWSRFTFLFSFFIRPDHDFIVIQLYQQTNAWLVGWLDFALSLISTFYFKVIKLRTTFFQLAKRKECEFYSLLVFPTDICTLITHSIHVIALCFFRLFLSHFQLDIKENFSVCIRLNAFCNGN